jgi:dephospho-CoA kinase
MKIIGITGTNASGKGTIVDYLVKNMNFTHYSVRSFLIQELEKRNLPLDRDHMRELGNELRANYGPSYIIEQLYLQAKEKGGNAIIESIRAV